MTSRADSLPFQTPSVLVLPSAAQAEESLRQTKRLFAKTLSGWAIDVLALRHAGKDTLMWNMPRANSFARKAA